jgi:hypothetical protein
MLIAGDFAEFRVLLDYMKNQEVFLAQRTPAYWGHPGMWTTECVCPPPFPPPHPCGHCPPHRADCAPISRPPRRTTHLSGAYDMSDYGCARDPEMPTWLMASGYLHVDQGGGTFFPMRTLSAPKLPILLHAAQTQTTQQTQALASTR